MSGNNFGHLYFFCYCYYCTVEIGDWLYDFVLAFLKSPAWVVPLQDFIDQNAIIFDNEEENQRTHHEAFNQFGELVSSLLEQNLEEIGILFHAYLRFLLRT